MTPETPTLPTSIVAELAICVRDIFKAIAEPAPVLFGRRFVAQEGAPRRVVFTEDRGKWTKDIGLFGGNKGYVAGEAMGCVVYVWGAPAPRLPTPGGYSEEDAMFHDTDDATYLRRRTVNAIQRAGVGTVDGDTIVLANIPDDDNYGQAYMLRFVLNTGVQKDAAIYSLVNGPNDPKSPPDPQTPPGAPASTVDKRITFTLV